MFLGACGNEFSANLGHITLYRLLKPCGLLVAPMVTQLRYRSVNNLGACSSRILESFLSCTKFNISGFAATYFPPDSNNCSSLPKGRCPRSKKRQCAQDEVENIFEKIEILLSLTHDDGCSRSIY